MCCRPFVASFGLAPTKHPRANAPCVSGPRPKCPSRRLVHAIPSVRIEDDPSVPCPRAAPTVAGAVLRYESNRTSAARRIYGYGRTCEESCEVLARSVARPQRMGHAAPGRNRLTPEGPRMRGRRASRTQPSCCQACHLCTICRYVAPSACGDSARRCGGFLRRRRRSGPAPAGFSTPGTASWWRSPYPRRWTP